MSFNTGFFIEQNTTTPPVIQYSMLFDGVNEQVTCLNNAAYNFERTDSFTISLWIYPTNLTGINSIISKRINSGAGWGVTTNGTMMVFQLINTDPTNRISVFNSAALTLNAWNHVVITYDGSSTAAGVVNYINTVVQLNTINADSLSATSQSVSNMYLGRNATSGVYFSGYMGIVRIWNSVLSVGEISQDYNGGNMNNITVSPSTNIFDWRAGTDALYTGSTWAFPDVSGTLTQTTPASSNMEYTDRTLIIP